LFDFQEPLVFVQVFIGLGASLLPEEKCVIEVVDPFYLPNQRRAAFRPGKRAPPKTVSPLIMLSALS
jgi:hypothetical protein